MEPLSFGSPIFLIGLALIPIVVVLYVRAERRPHAFAPAKLMPSVARRRAGWRRHAAVVGYGAAIAALLVALAKPQATVAVPTEQARVMIVTDRSGSMLARGRRAQPARRGQEGGRHVPRRRSRTGCASAPSPSTTRPRCCSRRPATTTPCARRSQSVKAAGSTATGDAITAALKSIPGKAPAAIVLLSDGKSVRGSDPVEAAQAAKDRKIPIYTVALGTAQGTINGGEAVPPDPETLAKIAKLTGGQVVHGRRPRRARPGLRAPRLPGRDREAQARGHEPLRRRRARADGPLRAHPRSACSDGRCDLPNPQGTHDPLPSIDPAADARRALEASLYECKRVVVGQDAMLERLLVALLTGGHVLLEGVPGLAKTLTVRTLATVLGGSFSRIQFTPDLVPADLVGTRLWQPGDGTFRTELGPVFANLLLADEINRAPAKVQSALLEVMQEHQVTIGGETHRVPEPYLVLATQNPIESEGTYDLPEAQVDRFLFKVVVDYPEVEDEIAVVDRVSVQTPRAHQAMEIEDLLAYQQVAREVFADRSTIAYAVSLVDATRHPGAPRPGRARAADPVRRQPARVAGPRAGRAGARAAARPHARRRPGRPRPRARRAPPPARPLLRRARRRRAARRPHRPACSTRSSPRAMVRLAEAA